MMKFTNKTVSTYNGNEHIEALKTITDMFESTFNKLNPDFLPNIYVMNLKNMLRKLLSFDVKNCDTCLFFDYIEEGTKSFFESIKCDLTFPGREYETKSTREDEKYRADKILNFKDFNIILKKGKVYFTEHEEKVFTTYVDIGDKIPGLKGKTFIDVVAYENGGAYDFDPRIVYIFCHTEGEIFVFSIKGEGNTCTLEHNVSKSSMGLPYKSIRSFTYTNFGHKILTIAYANEEIAFAIITDDKVEKRSIMDSGKSLVIHDVKITSYLSFLDRTGLICFIVKGQGFYIYSIKESKILHSFKHPGMVQIDKLTKNGSGIFIGIYIEQVKDTKEVIIELYNDKPSSEYQLNKVYTTNSLKFQSNLIASDDFYYLHSKDSLYLLPAREPNVINAIGAKLTVDLQGDFKLHVLDTSEGRAIVINDNTGSRVLYEKPRGKMVFQCEFSRFAEYLITMQHYPKYGMLGIESESFEYKVYVSEHKKLLFLE
jgi:hypothetical protein